MAFIREPGKFYRMPVFFGQMPCPRWWPDGVEQDFASLPKRDMLGVSYLTDGDKLQSMLPEGFSIWGDPVLTLELTYMTGFSWLAGGGYAMGDIKFPGIFQSKNGPVHGTFLMVRWENLADPILTGREELGHNKIPCEIHPVREFGTKHFTSLGWGGCDFVTLSVEGPKDTKIPEAHPDHKGLMSFKYIPATPREGEEWGVEADAAYATLTPPAWSGGKTLSYRTGTPNIEWRKATFEQQPTLHNVINALADLPIIEMRKGWVSSSIGGATGAETHRID